MSNPNPFPKPEIRETTEETKKRLEDESDIFIKMGFTADELAYHCTPIGTSIIPICAFPGVSPP